MALRFTRGSTGGIEIALTDAKGVAQDITGQTRVRVALAQSPESDVLIEWDTEPASDNVDRITVADSPAKVTVYPTYEQSLELPIGLVFAQVWITIDGHRSASRKFRMVIEEGVGE